MAFSGGPELGPDAFDEIIALQDAFRRTNKDLSLVAEPDGDQDVLYLGLYNQAADVEAMLQAAGVILVIDPEIEEDSGDQAEEEVDTEQELVRRIESELGNLQMSGNTLILLNESDGNTQVIVLAASSDGLENATDRLINLIPLDADYALADCLLAGPLAICPSNVSDEEVEFELVTSGAPETTPSDTTGDSTGDGGTDEDTESVSQGSISLGETVSGSLAEGESHSWTFSDGPETVDIILDGGEGMDGILELYDPEGELMASVDSSFAGEEEIIAGIEIPDDGDYTIVVREYFDDGGDYTLTVDVGSPQDPTDDFDATPQGEIPFGEEVSGELQSDELHAWTFSVDTATAVNITLESDPEMDVVLAVVDADFEIIAIVDDGLEGDGEVINDLALEPGDYTIVVGEFFGGAGGYTLLLEEADLAEAPGPPVVHVPAFLVPVDNGPGGSTILYFGSAKMPFSLK